MRLLLAGFVLLAAGALFADQKPETTPAAKHHHLRAKYHVGKSANSARCQHVVTVINGDSPMTTCSDVQTSSALPGGSRERQSAPIPGRVEIINGAAWSTRTFSATEKQIDVSPAQRANAHPVVTSITSSATEAEKPHPVVVAVVSSETAAGTGTTQPVVVGIESSGLDSNGRVAPAVIDVAPAVAPKRPPYHRPNPQ